MLLLFTASSGYSQNYHINERTRFYTEDFSGDSVLVKADNDFAIPLSVQLTFDLSNLQGVSDPGVLQILAPKTSGQVVARLRKVDPVQEYHLLYKWRIILGDVSKAPDQSFLYGYPVVSHQFDHISQGPGGDFSHQNSFAYDFAMPVGSPVVAARDGVIAFVDVSSDTGGPSPDFIDKANVISVLHTDGTIANYVHLSKDGATVKEGDTVKKGQLIARSGNTGYTTGAHLHFEVVQPNLNFADKKWVNFRWDDSAYAMIPAADIPATVNTGALNLK